MRPVARGSSSNHPRRELLLSDFREAVGAHRPKSPWREFMNRNLRTRLAVLAGSALLLLGVSSALGAAPAAAQSGKTCVVHSLPSFIAQGENVGGVETASTVADIVEVECDPTVYGTKSGVKITASQLYTRCDKRLTWYVPNNPPGSEGGETGGGEAGGFEEATGPGVSVRLDADGRAVVALLAGRN